MKNLARKGEFLRTWPAVNVLQLNMLLILYTFYKVTFLDSWIEHQKADEMDEMHVDCSHFCHRMFLCRLTVNIHYMKELKHKYCHCWPLVVTFVYYEFGTLSCATKLEKVPHFCTKYSRDWKCSPVISPDDIWALISWYLSFWGCKRHQTARQDSLVLLCSTMKKGNWPTILSLACSDKFWYAEKKQRKQLRKKKSTPQGVCLFTVSLQSKEPLTAIPGH